jgi:hypothetical protein
MSERLESSSVKYQDRKSHRKENAHSNQNDTSTASQSHVNPSPPPAPHDPLIESTGSARLLNLMKECFTTCVETHAECRVPTNYDNPTRLLALDSTPIRLVLASELQGSVPYATLSHCWGTTQLLRLSRSNIDQLRLAIPNSSLCKTFREAIVVARHFGIDYLWIDSLCIVQDDKDDWRVESLKMAEVYGFSTLNVAASGAEDGSVGCFFDRKPLYPRDLKRQLDQLDDAVLSAMEQKSLDEILYQRARGNTDDFISLSCYFVDWVLGNLSNSPLSRRAWAFQERVLSPRSLIFTAKQLFWECGHHLRCELDGLQAGLSHNTIDLRARTSEVQMFKWIYWSKELLLSIPNWIGTAEFYSQAKVTYPTDRLIALAGIAKRVQEYTHDEYLAGMWLKDLDIQLLWQTSYPADILESDEYVAPSWSWVCLGCYIWWTPSARSLGDDSHLRSSVRYIRIESVRITLVDPAQPLGAVTDGELRISFDAKTKDCCFAGRYDPTWTRISWDDPRRRRSVFFQLRVVRDEDNVSEGIIIEKVSDVRHATFRRIGIFSSRGSPELDPADESLFETHGDRHFLTLI